MNFPCRFTRAGVNTGKHCTRGSHCAVLGQAVLGCSAENSRIACGQGPRLWESENASLGEDLQPPQLWHPRDPLAPALEPLPKLQVIHSEICGPPFPRAGAPQVGLEWKTGRRRAALAVPPPSLGLGFPTRT